MPSTARMLARGIVRHCPRCGHGHLFRRWFWMADRCPHCGHLLNREEAFWLGAFVINFAVTEAALAVVLAGFIVQEANDRRPSAMAWIAIGLGVAVVVPLLCYPFSRTVWAAIDLAMHRGRFD